MVNYCCVKGCGRNSRSNKHLNFYSLPKERNRQVQWLKAAGRDDLLTKDHAKLTVSHRFCSRHFTPSSVKNNRNLFPDAVPTVNLPGSWEEAESDEDPLTHTNVACNSCSQQIVGFRYKCVTCPDFDLCQKCEMLETHSEHYMLRIPKPVKFKIADNLISKWREFFKAEHVTPDSDSENVTVISDSESSDDEPITKYAKNYDSGIDLSEDVKEKIRKEVNRVINLKPEERVINTKKNNKRPPEDIEMVDTGAPSKLMKFEDESVENNEYLNMVPEVVFADVNEPQMDLKAEYPNSIEGHSGTVVMPAAPESSVLPLPTLESTVQPVMHVKLSDDLSELMIEVTSNNQKTVYKYSDKPDRMP